MPFSVLSVSVGTQASQASGELPLAQGGCREEERRGDRGAGGGGGEKGERNGELSRASSDN